MSATTWRVLPLCADSVPPSPAASSADGAWPAPVGVPVWATACSRCGAASLESTGRFRVNAHGRRHDVWLVYRCPRCGSRRKRRILRRVAPRAAGVGMGTDGLDAYRRDDPTTAVAHAFAASPGGRVAYAVERPPLPSPLRLDVVIEQPCPCGVRWDRFLAGELGLSRARVAAAWKDGRIRVAGASRPGARLRDGQRLHVDLGSDEGRPPA